MGQINRDWTFLIVSWLVRTWFRANRIDPAIEEECQFPSGIDLHF